MNIYYSMYRESNEIKLLKFSSNKTPISKPKDQKKTNIINTKKSMSKFCTTRIYETSINQARKHNSVSLTQIKLQSKQKKDKAAVSLPKSNRYSNFKSSFIKLPQKLEIIKIRIRNQNQNRKIFLRPCYSNQEQFNGEITQKTKNLLNSDLKQSKIKSSWVIKSKDHRVFPLNYSHNVGGDNQNQEICFEMPNNSRFFVNKELNQCQESKVIEIQRVSQIQRLMNRSIVNQQDIQAFSSIETDTVQLQIINPLKIRTFYTQPIFDLMHKNIYQQLNTKFPPNKKNDLPTEQNIQEFIDNYEPKCPMINKNELKMKGLFQIQLKNNFVYFGQMKNGVYCGLGVYISRDEIKEGLWETGSIKKGMHVDKNGVYQGEFDRKGKCGEGKLMYVNGDQYIGRWFADQRSGIGYYKSQGKLCYMGNWKQGKFSGKGVLQIQISVYQGEFRDSLRTGAGKQKFVNGDSFIGLFQNNLPTKKGAYKWKSGATFQGQFFNGYRTGYGQLEQLGVLKYEGDFKNQFASGTGRIVYNNGDRYHGSMYQGQRSGRGDLVCNRLKKIYTGEWAADQLVYNQCN